MNLPKIPAAVKVVMAVFGLLVSLFSSTVVAAPGDEHWDTQFGWPGSTNPVLAMAVNNGRIYTGGYAASGFLTNALVGVWDGSQWSTIGQFGGDTVVLYDLAFVGDTLYVAGIFTNVNNVAVNGLARWDGSTWSSVGFNGYAYGLAVDGNNLYIGGHFTNVIGVTATNIGRWDGSAWHALGDGLGAPGFNDYVRAIVVANGMVYAGGAFTNSGSLAISNLAVWNGSGWSAVGGGANNLIYALNFNGSDMYAGGTFTMVGSTPVNYIARWDGANWWALGSGLGGTGSVGVNSITVFNGLVCVAGGFSTAGGITASNFATWNGSSWAAAGSGLSGSAIRAVSTATNVYVGGNFFLGDGGILLNFASWDGANWRPVGTPGRINGLQSSVRAIFDDGTNLYAGGLFVGAGQTTATRIARYDGTSWHAIGPGLNNTVNAVAAVGTNIYAAGDFTGGGGGYGPLAYHLAHWDGTYWSSLNNTAFNSVSELGVRSNDLFLSGPFTINSADGTASLLARWDGTNFWNVLAFDANDTFFGYYLNSVGVSSFAFQGTNIYLSGNFYITWHDPTLTYFTNCNNVMRFDGTYGRIMGTGLNSNATAIAVAGTNVYFGGPFTNAGGVTANHIAKWDGNNWSGVGGGVVGNGTVNALTVVGANLYAGGTFTNMGGVAASRIARWDGNSWSALGSGVSSTVSALGSRGSNLYAGGSFRAAGGKLSFFFGHWNESANFNTPQLIHPAWLTNRQFHSQLYGITGLTNIIQASTNLSSWTPVLTNSAGVYDFIDTSASNYPRRFYRAVLGP